MDKKIANSVIVGVVVTLGFVTFVFVLFTMGGGGIFNSQYNLQAKFSKVNGLHMGSEVLLAGLRVGVVKRISILPGDSKDLVASLDILSEYRDRIRDDSIASIKTAGVLGDKYIEVTIGSPEFQPLKSGTYIKTEEPPDLFSKSGQLVEGIAKEFAKGSDFNLMIHHMNEVSENLAVLTSDVRRKEQGLVHEMIYGSTGKKINKSAEHLEGILRKIDTGEGSLGALVNDPTVYEDIKSMLGGAKRSAILQYFMKQFIESGRKDEKKSSSK